MSAAKSDSLQRLVRSLRGQVVWAKRHANQGRNVEYHAGFASAAQWAAETLDKIINPREDPYAGLSVRAANVLNNNGLFRKADVAAALADGRLRPGKVRNYGAVTDAELRQWVSANASGEPPKADTKQRSKGERT